MSFLSARTRSELLDFLDTIADYLPENERVQVLAMLGSEEQQTRMVDAELLERAEQHAVVTWPARRAVQRYVEAEGAGAEWEKLLEAIRPTTALLLRRLRERSGVRTLTQALLHPEGSSAVQAEERLEIELARSEIWADLWAAKLSEVETHHTEAKKELEMMRQRLQKLQQYSARAEKQAELERKIREFEGRIYAGGESIPLETLDEELRLTIQEVLIPEGE